VSKGNGRNQSDDDEPTRPENEMNSRPAEFEDAMDKATDIPKFDLAEQIMAEQRKVAATRRKGPGKRVDAPKRQRLEPVGPAVVEPSPVSSEEEKVIAEIVARDIQDLCRGHALNLGT
jgi:hypothetical protein